MESTEFPGQVSGVWYRCQVCVVEKGYSMCYPLTLTRRAVTGSLFGCVLHQGFPLLPEGGPRAWLGLQHLYSSLKPAVELQGERFGQMLCFPGRVFDPRANLLLCLSSNLASNTSCRSVPWNSLTPPSSQNLIKACPPTCPTVSRSWRSCLKLPSSDNLPLVPRSGALHWCHTRYRSSSHHTPRYCYPATEPPLLPQQAEIFRVVTKHLSTFTQQHVYPFCKPWDSINRIQLAFPADLYFLTMQALRNTSLIRTRTHHLRIIIRSTFK